MKTTPISSMTMFLLLCLGLAALEPQAAVAATIYVDAAASGGNTGTSWKDAYPDLQNALSIATSDDEIWVAAGTYFPSIEHGGTGDRYKSFQMKNGVGIYGGFAGGETSRDQRNWVNNVTTLSGDIGTPGDDADNCYHVFYHPDGTNLDSTAILDGFTITAGNANGSSSHDYGGGMSNCYSSPILTNCTFSGNLAAGIGGGMFNDCSSPTLTNCTFCDNSTNAHGGGMSNRYSSPTLTNCTFSDNSADYYDGGMHNNNYSSPTLTNCIFSGNSADYAGGGMGNNNYSSPILANCTFSDNSASNYGGGMCNVNSSPTLTNCTFWGNSAGYGGGMSNGSSSPILINCIVWGNTGSEISYGSGSSPTVTYCDVQGGYSGIGNIDANPLFVDSANGNFHLQPDSPCIDAGNNAASDLPATDFEGDDRIIDGDGNGTTIVDMGVDEANLIKSYLLWTK